MLEYCGGTLRKEPGPVDTRLEAARIDWVLATDDKLKVARTAAWEHILAIAFHIGSDQV